MRRLALLIPVLLLATSCHWAQDFHWRRISGTPTADGAEQTVIYWQLARLREDQKPFVRWAASKWNESRRVDIRLGPCPATTPRNCVPFITADLPSPWGGLASIGTNGKHILIGSGTWVKLDVALGRTISDSESRRLAYEESCHSLGGGWDPDVHHICGPPFHDHSLAAIGRVYGSHTDR